MFFWNSLVFRDPADVGNLMHWSLRKAFLSLLAILWNSAFKCVYLSFSPLPFSSLLFIAVCKASSNNHLAFLHFFFLEVVLITVSCTMLGTSVHSSPGDQIYISPFRSLYFPETCQVPVLKYSLLAGNPILHFSLTLFPVWSNKHGREREKEYDH